MERYDSASSGAGAWDIPRGAARATGGQHGMGEMRAEGRWRQYRCWRGPAGLVGLGLLVALVLAGCGAGTTALTSAQILQKAQTTFNNTQSFHFVLTATHLGVNDPQPITSANGDVKRPDRLQATANTSVGGFNLSVRLVVIGQQAWLDPGIGGFQPDNAYASFLQIFDPQQGVGSALVNMRQPSAPQDSTSNGTACWKISGQVSTSVVAAVVNGDVLSNQTVPATVCIGKSDDNLYSIVLSGAVTQTDTAQTVRTFTLSKFNQPVTILAPSD